MYSYAKTYIDIIKKTSKFKSQIDGIKQCSILVNSLFSMLVVKNEWNFNYQKFRNIVWRTMIIFIFVYNNKCISLTYFFQVHLMTLKLLSSFYNLQSSLDKILGECSEQYSRGSVFIKANCVLCILKY